MPDTLRVHIRYPTDGQDGDEAWLDTAALRHDGDLADGVMLSCPAQRIVTVSIASQAESFVDELNASGRWVARIIRPD